MRALFVGLLAVSALAADAQENCRDLADVPEPRMELEPPPPPGKRPPLRRVHSLLRLFSEGDGTLFESSGRPPAPNAPSVGLYPLPWHVAPARAAHATLVTWQDHARRNDENLPAIVLQAGERWCTSALDRPAGARLRFEAVSTGRTRGTIAVGLDDGEPLFETRAEPPGSFEARRQADVELGRGRESICFEASTGTVAVGEPRILAPEESGDDGRPRWIVLTLIDTLRGDLARNEAYATLAPTLHHLRETGQSYEKAISPGCHTRASVWPILMGRDLMRIDPLQRRQRLPIQSPLETVYSRANSFVTHAAESAGYHSVFLGNNGYLRVIPAFSRYSSWGRTDTSTVDTVERIPDLLSRYADERVFLLYYVSTPHTLSKTPRRLYDALRCSEREGLDACFCAYEARVRHADEAVAALETALRAYGLEDDVLQIVTADHGELFGDAFPLEGEVPSFASSAGSRTFQRFDAGHGNACDPRENDVPLIFHGKAIAPARWEGAVSGLDVVPTLLERMGLPRASRLDGVPLPFGNGRSSTERPIVSYGFCADTRREGEDRLRWWVGGCRVRESKGGPIEHLGELWRGEERVGTDASRPALVRGLMERHEQWLRERLPSEAFVFGTSGVNEAAVVVRVEGGRITDYGPSSSVYGLDGIEVVRSPETTRDGAELKVKFRGYRGLYHVSTLPPRAKLRITVEGPPDVVTFVGPLQLPLDVAGRALDPTRDAGFLVSRGIPEIRTTDTPSLHFWWESGSRPSDGAGERHFSEFERVLREWGYIR